MSDKVRFSYVPSVLKIFLKMQEITSYRKNFLTWLKDIIFVSNPSVFSSKFKLVHFFRLF